MAENAECDHLPVATAASGTNCPSGTAKALSTTGSGAGLQQDIERIWAVLVAECDELGGVQWEWQPADAMLGKDRFGGKKRARIPPTGKKGTKKSLVTDGDGGPLGVVIAGANVLERRLLAATIESIVVERPTDKG